jgi:phosphoadenosine phosphosulfate reductase
VTGTAAIDMISKISRKRKQPHLVPLVFIDTLYHFQETLDLVKEVEKKYKVEVQVFYPPGVSTTAEFEAKYGEKLWEEDEDTYDYLVKVRFRFSLFLTAFLPPSFESLLPNLDLVRNRRKAPDTDPASSTGRACPTSIRHPWCQGRHHRSSPHPGSGPCYPSTPRNRLDRPLCTWGFQEVKDYIDMAGVPYNPLLDQGYKSVGDWHSTVLPKEGESERSGRWASNKTKTECGLHKVRLLPHLSRAQPRR